mgnify:FL=1
MRNNINVRIDKGLPEKLIIQRPPTGDSIRLLNEMQEKVKLNVINNFNLSNNTFKCLIAVVDEITNLQGTSLYFSFLLNEVRYTFKRDITVDELNCLRSNSDGKEIYSIYEDIEKFVIESTTSVIINHLMQNSSLAGDLFKSRALRLVPSL